MTTYEMKNTLDGYPADVLLQVGLPDIKFYAEGNQLQALRTISWATSASTCRRTAGSALSAERAAPVCTP